MDSNKMHHITLHKEKKPWFKRVWVWIMIVFVLMVIGGASTGNSQQPAKAEPSQHNQQAPLPEPAKWDVDAAYNKVQNGMTKAQVEEAIGKKAENCTESQSEYIGKSEVCTYGNVFIDKSAIIITFMQDKVNSKAKSSY